jgi:hypothetical protein
VKLQEKIDVFRVEAGTSFHRNPYRKFVEKNHEEWHQRLMAEFFSDDPVCHDKIF